MFEQIEPEADECAKCGVLFEKFLAREQEQHEAVVPPQDYELGVASPEASATMRPIEYAESDTGVGPMIGTLMLRLGPLMVVLPALSFLLNMVGMEFILLSPLELFENPTRAKLWIIGGGIGMAVLGGMLGGENSDDD